MCRASLCRPPSFRDSFRDWIGHREALIGDPTLENIVAAALSEIGGISHLTDNPGDALEIVRSIDREFQCAVPQSRDNLIIEEIMEYQFHTGYCLSKRGKRVWQYFP